MERSILSNLREMRQWGQNNPPTPAPAYYAFDSADLRTAINKDNIPDEKASFKGFDASDGVAIGERMAWRHPLGLGSRITIITPDGPDTVIGNAPRIRDYPVVAFF